MTDIAACYYRRGTQLDGGKSEKPVCVVNLEFYADASHSLVLFGATEDMVQRECVALFLESINVLSAAAAGCNTEASN